MDIKILKNGTISKTSLKKVDFENLDFDNTNDIGMNSVGVLRFSLEVIQVISGTEKKVGDKFTKRGKNLYGNYHEIEHSSKEYLSLKHKNRASLGGTIWE